jgi:DNA-nicking Smr family endonuclease
MKKPFHSPFAEPLGAMKKSLNSNAPAQPSHPPTAPIPPELGDSEETNAMLDLQDTVRPLAKDKRGRLPATSPNRRKQTARSRASNEIGASLDGSSQAERPFVVSDAEASIFGHVHGLHPDTLKTLQRGEYALDDRLDLHGLTKEEARQAVDAYLQRAQLRRYRCVLIVHGRGLHSEQGVPILKDAVISWLSEGALSHSVLAFASARPIDGGSGATYVLLRKQRP